MSLFSKVSFWVYKSIFLAKARKRPSKPRPFEFGERPKILAFTCAGIGDTLTDSVVFKALKERWPLGNLSAVVHKRREFLLTHNPFVDQVYCFQKGPLAFQRLYQELKRAGPWDAILHLRGNDPEPRCLSWLLDPDVAVSTPNMTRLSELCGHQVVQPDWDATHGVEQTLRLARYIGADTQEPHLVYRVTDAERESLEKKLASLWNDPPFSVAKARVVFQIGGGRRAAWRDWPAECYTELISNLGRDLNAEFILLAGREPVLKKKAEEIITAVAKIDPNLKIRSAAGRLNLAESAALLSSARALVSTDTGIMHLGFAVGVRVVALIHFRNPATRVGPYGYGNRHLVHQLPTTAVSMAEILPGAVADSVRAIWKEAQR